MDARNDSEAVAVEPPPATASAAAEDEDELNNEEEDLLFVNVQTLADKITASPDNPNPDFLHALASILETQEARYMEDTFDSSVNNIRASHTIGRLGNLIRENDDFFELISSKFLSESRYSISVRAAAVRVLFSCSMTWMYPHVFEENVLESIKGWVLNDTTRSSGDDCNWNNDGERQKSSDTEMLRTYSTGILAICLAGGGQIVEDVLTSGLSAKLMRYLRIRSLGETSKKDANHAVENKVASATSIKGKEEGRNRFRHVSDGFQLDAPRIIDGVVGDQVAETDREGCDGWRGQDLHDRKTKFSERYGQGRYLGEEDFDDGGEEDSSRRRVNRGWGRSRVRGIINEEVTDIKHGLTSTGTGT